MQHEEATFNFRKNYRHALSDAKLQLALTTATSRFTVNRQSAVADAGADWERLRSRARQIKEHTINHLDYYLEEFSSNVERLGGHIFWARDAAQANQYVADLARARQVKLAVKSKSMMTEEIGLNGALANAGIEALETDLGEYIIQLAGERPSHINAPAIHKTRGEIADLFTEKLHAERTEDVGEMTSLARRTLRQRFIEAEMGVSGVNFAVAETGTIVLVENEGNIRLVTSLPRMHVAVMGIEKVIPRLEDMGVFLRLLGRSAAGQKMTSYVSYITGVKDSAADEGPEELHIIILDNGRTDILANPHLRESLFCIRCGACLNTCPVYQKIGGHAYGWTYPGPIGSVLTPQLVGRDKAAALPFASSLCGACRDVCPIKINIPDMLLHLRSEIKEGERQVGNSQDSFANSPQQTPPTGADAVRRTVRERPRQGVELLAERLAFKCWGWVVRSERLYRLAAAMMRYAQKAHRRVGGLSRSLPGLSTDLMDSIPTLAPRSFRQQWRATAHAPHDDANGRMIEVEADPARLQSLSQRDVKRSKE